MNTGKNLTGRTFGRLTVIEKVGSTSGGNALWKCRCSCPDHREVIVRADCLVGGRTTSCGCLLKELNSLRYTKYKDDDTKRIVSIFYGMRTRCYNKKDPGYINYGGRGITICDEWLTDINKFIEWSKSHGYSKGLTIDRIDTNKGYSPDNCRWTTTLVQNNNMRSNRMFTLMKMRKSIADWARYFGVDPHIMWHEPDHVVSAILKDLMYKKLSTDASSKEDFLSLLGVSNLRHQEVV